MIFVIRFNLLVLALICLCVVFILVYVLLRPPLMCPLRMSSSKDCIRPKIMRLMRCRTHFRHIHIGGASDTEKRLLTAVSDLHIYQLLPTSRENLILYHPKRYILYHLFTTTNLNTKKILVL